jgi:hypothetical protein
VILGIKTNGQRMAIERRPQMHVERLKLKIFTFIILKWKKY